MWGYLLHRLLGIGEPPGGAKFGPGVVGHTAYVVIASLTASVAIAWALSADAKLAFRLIAILVGLLALFLVATWIFSHLHPDQAAMGGSWWFRFRQMQMETKYQEDMKLLTPTTDPLKPAPPSLAQIEELDEDDRIEGAIAQPFKGFGAIDFSVEPSAHLSAAVRRHQHLNVELRADLVPQGPAATELDPRAEHVGGHAIRHRSKEIERCGFALEISVVRMIPAGGGCRNSAPRYCAAWAPRS